MQKWGGRPLNNLNPKEFVIILVVLYQRNVWVNLCVIPQNKNLKACADIRFEVFNNM